MFHFFLEFSYVGSSFYSFIPFQTNFNQEFLLSTTDSKRCLRAVLGPLHPPQRHHPNLRAEGQEC